MSQRPFQLGLWAQDEKPQRLGHFSSEEPRLGYFSTDEEPFFGYFSPEERHLGYFSLGSPANRWGFSEPWVFVTATLHCSKRMSAESGDAPEALELRSAASDYVDPDRQPIVISKQDYRQFIDRTSKPPAPSPAQQALMRWHRQAGR